MYTVMMSFGQRDMFVPLPRILFKMIHSVREIDMVIFTDFINESTYCHSLTMFFSLISSGKVYRSAWQIQGGVQVPGYYGTKIQDGDKRSHSQLAYLPTC